MKKRVTALLLSALLAALPLASCGSTDSGDEVTTDSQTGEDTSTSEIPTETSGVPDDLDLEGETINIWYTTESVSVAETYVDIAGELTGDIMDDTIYNLNRSVEEKLNCTLNFYNSGCLTSETGAEVPKLILAGDTSYDVYHVVQWNAAKLAAEGYYLNVYDAPYLSLDKPWWDAEYMQEMTVGENTIYALVGDYAIDRTRCLDCVYYNKDMYEDFYRDRDGLYTEVLEGNWTWEMLRQISSDVYSDLNNDGVATRDDRLGYCINDYNNLDALFYGTGARVTERDEEGMPTLVLNNERVANIIEDVYELCFNTEGVYFSGPLYEDDVANRTLFENGNSMFLFGFFYTIEAMREMKSDYGIIPFPKYDSDQTEYVSVVHDIMRMMVLPSNCTKVDSVCAVLEELAFQGYNDLLPAYYNVVLKEKYVRDDVSAQMIDIIRDSCSTDIAYVYGDAFNGMGYITRYLMQAKSSNFASEYAKREAAAITQSNDFIEQFLSNE